MTHKNLVVTAAMFLLLTVIATGSAPAQQYVFRSVDVPGAAETIVGGNNNAGEITGCYPIAGFSSDGVGFLLANGAFKAVKYPGPVSTCLTGMSNNGKIAGYYADTSGKVHGFLLVGKTYTKINYPGAVDTYA